MNSDDDMALSCCEQSEHGQYKIVHTFIGTPWPPLSQRCDVTVDWSGILTFSPTIIMTMAMTGWVSLSVGESQPAGAIISAITMSRM